MARIRTNRENWKIPRAVLFPLPITIHWTVRSDRSRVRPRINYTLGRIRINRLIAVPEAIELALGKIIRAEGSRFVMNWSRFAAVQVVVAVRKLKAGSDN